MEHINPAQDWGATGGVPPGVTVALKNGFAVVNRWQINTTGWVDGDGRDYYIAVLTDTNATESYGIDPSTRCPPSSGMRSRPYVTPTRRLPSAHH